MAVNDYYKYLRLSRVINDEFGTPGPGVTKLHHESVRFEAIDEELLKAFYITTITFTTQQIMHETMRQARDEGVEKIKKAIERTKEKYNELKPENEKQLNLTIKDQTLDESVEMIHVSAYSPIRRAFYRVFVYIDVN